MGKGPAASVIPSQDDLQFLVFLFIYFENVYIVLYYMHFSLQGLVCSLNVCSKRKIYIHYIKNNMHLELKLVLTNIYLIYNTYLKLHYDIIIIYNYNAATQMLLLMQVLLYIPCSVKKQKALVMVLLVYWDGIDSLLCPADCFDIYMKGHIIFTQVIVTKLKNIVLCLLHSAISERFTWIG